MLRHQLQHIQLEHCRGVRDFQLGGQLFGELTQRIVAAGLDVLQKALLFVGSVLTYCILVRRIRRVLLHEWDVEQYGGAIFMLIAERGKQVLGIRSDRNIGDSGRELGEILELMQVELEDAVRDELVEESLGEDASVSSALTVELGPVVSVLLDPRDLRAAIDLHEIGEREAAVALGARAHQFAHALHNDARVVRHVASLVELVVAAAVADGLRNLGAIVAVERLAEVLQHCDAATVHFVLAEVHHVVQVF